MKKIVLSLAFSILCFMSTQISFAQGHDDHDSKMTVEQRADVHSYKMKVMYNLTDAQTTSLKNLFIEEGKKMEGKKVEMKAKAEELKTERKEMHEKMKAHHEAMDLQIKKILTPEQFENYSKDKEARKEKMEERHEKHMKMKEDLENQKH